MLSGEDANVERDREWLCTDIEGEMEGIAAVPDDMKDWRESVMGAVGLKQSVLGMGMRMEAEDVAVASGHEPLLEHLKLDDTLKKDLQMQINERVEENNYVRRQAVEDMKTGAVTITIAIAITITISIRCDLKLCGLIWRRRRRRRDT